MYGQFFVLFAIVFTGYFFVSGISKLPIFQKLIQNYIKNQFYSTIFVQNLHQNYIK